MMTRRLETMYRNLFFPLEESLVNDFVSFLEHCKDVSWEGKGVSFLENCMFFNVICFLMPKKAILTTV